MGSTRKQLGLWGQFGVLAIGIGLLSFIYVRFTGGNEPENPEIHTPSDLPKEQSYLPPPRDYVDLLPSNSRGQLVDHQFFTLSFREDYKIAEWVAYELDVERLNMDLDRSNDYREDASIRGGSASLEDYRGSGFDRGHLVPAADMAYNPDAMSGSFFMSNMTPQDQGFNRGVWRELEEQVRDWTRSCTRLFIVTGPVLTDNPMQWIGEGNRVAVPKYYYKVLLDYEEPEYKAIAFLLPNARTDRSLDEFAVSVDEVEALTGLDFFANLPDDLEDNLEAGFNPFRWPYDAERYKDRVEVWNNK